MNERPELKLLVTQAQRSDASAFSEIVFRFQDMAVGYAYSLLGDVQSAEDAAQEAFLDAFRALEQLREPAAFPGWFKRIVYKHCDRQTRRGRLAVVSIDKMAARPASAGTDPVDELVRQELAHRIGDAVRALPEAERTAITLFHMSGYSHAELAEFLDVPVTTVKKRLHTARKRLRDALAETLDAELGERRPSRDGRFAASLLELLEAARSGDTSRVRDLLLRDHRLASARDWLGNSAIVLAVNSGQTGVADLLRASGVVPSLHEAAAIGDTERVRELLHVEPHRRNEFSAEGFTPLMFAAHFGHLETVAALVDLGAAIDVVSSHPLGVTALHTALFAGQSETAAMLLDRGANPWIRRGGAGWPREGWTALDYAEWLGDRALVERIAAIPKETT